MRPNIIFPQELLDEIESYAKIKGITVREFIIWAVGEKIGELRQRLGQKNLTNLNPTLHQNSIDSNREMKQLPIVPPLLKTSELSKLLQISKSCAYRLMKTGEIPTIRIGKSVRVRKEDLERFIDGSRNITE
jgi:excisionase family DNA binding protein